MLKFKFGQWVSLKTIDDEIEWGIVVGFDSIYDSDEQGYLVALIPAMMKPDPNGVHRCMRRECLKRESELMSLE